MKRLDDLGEILELGIVELDASARGDMEMGFGVMLG